MTAGWAVPFVTIALTQVAVIATSIYLHRALAHRSLRVYSLADVVFRTALWLTTGQCRQEWVAVHRKHHAFTDREGDPHSPRLLGFWRLHNNHHAHPRSARFSVRRSEFDPSWPILRSLAAAGLLVILGPPIAWTRATPRRSTP
jgi:stearoyl-CoA desaturase (delta-9 desaturase)